MLTLNQINDIIDSKISMNRPTKILNLFNNRCFIYDYIKNFYRYNENLDKSTIIVAIIYVQRYNKVCKLTSSNHYKNVIMACTNFKFL